MAETMSAARHSSVSTSLAYQRRCGVSETARFAALGGDDFADARKRKAAGSDGNMMRKSQNRLHPRRTRQLIQTMAKCSMSPSTWVVLETKLQLSW